MSFFFRGGAAVDKPVHVPAPQNQDFFIHVGDQKPAEYTAKFETSYLASCEYTNGAVTGAKSAQADWGFALSAQLNDAMAPKVAQVRLKMTVTGVGFPEPEGHGCLAVKPSFANYVRYEGEVSVPRDGTPLELPLEGGASLTITALGR
ncbi:MULTISPECIES: hypothetical protein [Achromobacter]|uniref:hypothetical protein n=1 Tax=Achromobacter TaxID=222 RepID=UPI0023F8B9BA|nr:hypothetical protein [Achromobacter anxifer]MDF8363345.1 hypothetical protein [Achromobacter anxifer]